MKTIAYALIGVSLTAACASKVSGTDTPSKGYVYVQLDQYAETLDDGGTAVTVSLGSEVYPTTTGSSAYTTVGKEGACTARRRALSADAGATSPSSENIGSVTVKGGALPREGLTAGPDAKLATPATRTGPAGYVGGETMEFTATGGTLPGFAARLVVAPTKVEITSPAPDADGRITLDRATPLTVRWTGGGEGTVNLTLSSRDPATDTRVLIYCELPGKDGQAVVPASLLANLPLTNASAMASTTMGLYPETADTKTTGGWEYGIYISNDSDYRSVNVAR